MVKILTVYEKTDKDFRIGAIRTSNSETISFTEVKLKRDCYKDSETFALFECDLQPNGENDSIQIIQHSGSATFKEKEIRKIIGSQKFQLIWGCLLYTSPSPRDS
eukprot:TRINITY_DN13864_c0_g1_i1.p1 TRINITY_DN13864_c0_g1~~TRINITY_DN13864_c0_g1_i1.p1  ORF type:complete len:105 (-),score=6.29 TRINITY_DN13864_c0_g1_i1:37-351(-)